jgi:hypothetical protein
MLKNKLLSAMGGAPANYIEDVFSTWLYTGNGSTQTITNGIDLAGKGGLVWLKQRSGSPTSHTLMDTARGTSVFLSTNNANANTAYSVLSSFNTNGFTIGQGAVNNASGQTYASWTFREQPKFFDVVTFTGTGAPQTVSHNLGSTPGCMIIKCTSTTSAWYVYHRSVDGGSGQAYLALNTTAAADSTVAFTNTPPTSTVFYVGDGIGQNPINQNGATYVAYLFAHNAGGFGLTGTDNVITCGSFTTDGSGNATVNLGYEPQYLLLKRSDSTSSWLVVDGMRGMSETSDAFLYPDLSSAEQIYSSSPAYVVPKATGFQWNAAYGSGVQTWIYIAIRRGPMKVPTDGTKVFAPVAYTGNGASSRSFTNPNFAPDLIWTKSRSNGTDNKFMDRLRGTGKGLNTNDTSTEGSAAGYYVTEYGSLGWTLGIADASYNNSGFTYGAGAFRRAPGFFDEVCYTGTGVARTINHNLAAVPELIIVKCRSTAVEWPVYAAALGNTNTIFLDATDASSVQNYWNNTTPTSSVFSVRTPTGVNGSGQTYVAYLFATCPGVSKCGSYTGTGTTQQINCGFTAGSRFVLIKRTDSTGDWYVWDSARGIVSGNDPYLLLNSTAAEVTSTDYVDTYSAGFEISSTAPAAINASGGTFIFLAIA